MRNARSSPTRELLSFPISILKSISVADRTQSISSRTTAGHGGRSDFSVPTAARKCPAPQPVGSSEPPRGSSPEVSYRFEKIWLDCPSLPRAVQPRSTLDAAVRGLNSVDQCRPTAVSLAVRNMEADAEFRQASVGSTHGQCCDHSCGGIDRVKLYNDWPRQRGRP